MKLFIIALLAAISYAQTEYGITIDGDGCNSGRISDEQECKTATQALGGTYGKSFSGKSDVPGCIYANDGRNKVYFNKELNANGHNSKYQEICKASTCNTPKKGICEDKVGLYGNNKETIRIYGIWDSFTEDDCFKECAKYAATDGKGCCHYGPESSYSLTSNPVCYYVIGDRIKPNYSSPHTQVLRVSECGASSNLAMGSEVLKAANTKMMRQIEQAVGVSESAVGSGYGLTIDGDQCNSGRITTEEECKTATKTLGGTYAHSFSSKSDAPGCVYATDGSNKVGFNLELNANGHNSYYKEICKASSCNTPKKGICEDKVGLYGNNKETIRIWNIWDSFTEDDCFKECAKYAATDGEGCCHYGPESSYSLTSNPVCYYVIGDRIKPGYSSPHTEVLRVSECGASSNLAMGSSVLKAANTKIMRQIEQAVGDSVDQEVLACMEEYETGIVSDGLSWVIRQNPGLIAPGGMMYDSRAMAANLAEFEGMYLAIIECVKVGSMKPITSGEYKWFAPSGRPKYNIYTQKAGCIEEYGSYKERVQVFTRWIETADGARYAPCEATMSSAGKERYIKYLKDAQKLWQKEFGMSGSANTREHAREANQVIGTTENAVLIFAAIGAMSTIYYGLKGAHKVLFTTDEFQKIASEC